MPGNFREVDIRVRKTNEALINVMSKLLDLRNFNKITVIDICAESLISRATFYAHFHDKYDLLEHWLAKMKSEIISESVANKCAKKNLITFINYNEKKIRHLIEDANDETLGLICNFFLSLFDIDTDNVHMSIKHTVLLKFCCGGIMNYLGWQATNKLKSDSEMMNAYLYDILSALNNWNEEHE